MYKHVYVFFLVIFSIFIYFIFVYNNSVVSFIGDDNLSLRFKRWVILLLAFVPFNVLAYSKEIVAGGENIGIRLNTNGVMIVGTYEVNGQNPASKAGLKTGDCIIEINGNEISTIDDMADNINDGSSEIKIKYLRGLDIGETNMKIYKDESNIYKTGLFVKDSVTGIGTLTFVDPKTRKFGALGHEIAEQSTGKILDIKDGKIYDSNVTGVIPSDGGNPGEKKAEFNDSDIKGIASENTSQGVFGNYTDSLDEKKLYKVMNPNEVKLGEAKLLTVLKGKDVKEYDIVITQINSTTSKTKNFIFEITDDKLLKETGGIVQGMSGSPIVRDGNIVGAVTHVVVNEPNKGYGIFITNMLEEAEK